MPAAEGDSLQQSLWPASGWWPVQLAKRREGWTQWSPQLGAAQMSPAADGSINPSANRLKRPQAPASTSICCKLIPSFPLIFNVRGGGKMWLTEAQV